MESVAFSSIGNAQCNVMDIHKDITFSIFISRKITSENNSIQIYTAPQSVDSDGALAVKHEMKIMTQSQQALPLFIYKLCSKSVHAVMWLITRLF